MGPPPIGQHGSGEIHDWTKDDRSEPKSCHFPEISCQPRGQAGILHTHLDGNSSTIALIKTN